MEYWHLTLLLYQQLLVDILYALPGYVPAKQTSAFQCSCT
jgi:hypothetical protein